MAKAKAEKPLHVQLAERDDFSDLLGLIPTWIFGAIAWFIFTKLILDKLTDKKPGTEINLAIIASDVAGVTFPPGVALAAQIDVTLSAIGFKTDLVNFLEKAVEKPPGLTGAETAINLAEEFRKAVIGGILLITGIGRK